MDHIMTLDGSNQPDHTAASEANKFRPGDFNPIERTKNSKTLTTTLPQEIKDEILYHLWDDKHTLRACALTCHSFLHPAQRVIFSKVTLIPPTTRKPSDTYPGLSSVLFETLLKSSPQLCHYVRHLEVSDPNREWLLDDPSISRFLPLLTELKSIIIEHGMYVNRQSEPVWAHSFLSALISVAHLPSLEFLGFTEFPLALIEHGRHLTHLSIRELTLQKFPLPLACSGACDRKLVLHSLELQTMPDDRNSDFFQILHDAINITKIKRLFAMAEDTIEGHHILWSILRNCASSLEELMFDPCCEIYDEAIAMAEPIDWSILTSLRVFSTKIEMASDYDQDDETLLESFHWLMRVLDQLSSSNKCLEEITIQANYAFGGLQVELSHWNEITSRLLDRIRFPRLRKVEIKLGSFDSDEEKEEITVELEEHVDRLRQDSNPRLDVTLSLADAYEPLRSFFPQAYI